MDPPLEEEERERLDCEFQPIPDSRKIEDLIGSGEFESSRSLKGDLWLAIILASSLPINDWSLYVTVSTINLP